MKTNKTTLNQDTENLNETLEQYLYCIMVTKYRPPITARGGNCRMTTVSVANCRPLNILSSLTRRK